jgi:hypothetical protein
VLKNVFNQEMAGCQNIKIYKLGNTIMEVITAEKKRNYFNCMTFYHFIACYSNYGVRKQ